MKPARRTLTQLLAPPPLSGPVSSPAGGAARRGLRAAWHTVRAWRPAAGDALDQVYLAGGRGPDRLRLIVAVDVSLSMSGFASARDAALRAFLAWMPANLRADDETAVVDFAASSALRLPPTTVDLLAPVLPPPPPLDGRTTLLLPLLSRVRAVDSSGMSVAVVLLSDAQLADLPGTETGGRQALQAHHIDQLALLVPGHTIQVPDGWATTFPQAHPIHFDGADPQQTALALARVLATLTGQTLRRA